MYIVPACKRDNCQKTCATSATAPAIDFPASASTRLQVMHVNVSINVLFVIKSFSPTRVSHTTLVMCVGLLCVGCSTAHSPSLPGDAFYCNFCFVYLMHLFMRPMRYFVHCRLTQHKVVVDGKAKRAHCPVPSRGHTVQRASFRKPLILGCSGYECSLNILALCSLPSSCKH